MFVYVFVIFSVFVCVCVCVRGRERALEETKNIKGAKQKGKQCAVKVRACVCVYVYVCVFMCVFMCVCVCVCLHTAGYCIAEIPDGKDAQEHKLQVSFRKRASNYGALLQ